MIVCACHIRGKRADDHYRMYTRTATARISLADDVHQRTDERGLRPWRRRPLPLRSEGREQGTCRIRALDHFSMCDTSKRYAVVTGCNRGLGFGIARRLTQEGFHVAALCRQLKDAQRTVRALGSGCCVAIQLDIAEGDVAVRKAVAQVVDWLGPSKLALLINNAGNSYDAWNDESWVASRAVNYQGGCRLTEALLPSFSDGASVTMVGSGLGDLNLLSPKFQRLLTRARTISALDEIADLPINRLSVECSWVGPYGMSKALLHRATEIFAADPRFTTRGIQLSAVCPGWVCTDMGGEQAPISIEEGAGHILEKPLHSAAAGTLRCFCFKNYDEEHNRAWEEKHGKWTDDDDYTTHGHNTKQLTKTASRPSSKRLRTCQ